MRIDHTESYEDFGEQFLVDSKIDGYFGSQEMLGDIIKPFDLRRLKGKNSKEVRGGAENNQALSLHSLLCTSKGI